MQNLTSVIRRNDYIWESLVCSNNKAKFGKAEGRRMKNCVERKSLKGRLGKWSEMILRASHAEFYVVVFPVGQLLVLKL